MTGRDRPKSRAITIYLIKSNYTAPEDIFTIGERSRHEFFIDGLPATLYLRKSQEKIPNWTSLFESYIDFEGLELESFSTSAILLLEVSNRIFALTFGYGRFFLKPWVWEENFGLKVSLNSIDPAKLRIIDHKTLDTIAFHTREQSSRDASLSDFDLDTQQDLIKAVTGIPSEEILGTRMTGVDSLTTNVKMNLNDVPALLESYLEKFRENTYRSTFPNIDYISEVRDVSVIEELDNSLIQKIQEGNLEKVWAAVPDLIDWTDNSGFKVSVLEESIDDIYLPFLLEKMGARSFSTEFLKKNYVARLDSIGFQKERWPLYKCLYGEVDYNGRNYILNNGKWYALEQGFVAQVDTDIGQIGESNVTLPPYQDASEGHYNIRAASINPDFYSLDAQQIMFGGGHSSIEFCDLYCRTKKIIHVKRYSGSSTLSHLFSQGTVSAEIFLSDSGFRSNVNELLPDTHKFTDPLIRPNPQEFEVVYAIVSKSANPLNLPFFSKVNLRNAFNRLNLMGFDCKLNKIQNAND